MASQQPISIRRRGRPITDSSRESEAVKARRERNREAQHIFRKRKQAAEAAQMQRLRRLEDVVEEMSSVFCKFVDDMLQTEMIKQHPGLLASLKSTMAHVIALANEVVSSEENPCSDDAGAVFIGALADSAVKQQCDNDTQGHSEARLPPQSPGSGASNEALPQDPSPILTQPTVLSPPQSALSPTATSSTSKPVVRVSPALITPAWAPQSTLSPESFAYRLTITCLRTGYLLLSKSPESPVPHSEEERIFGPSLCYRTRDDLLLGMKWLLGPGRSQIYRAVDLPSGRYGVEEFTNRDLSPDLSDLKASNMNKPSQSRFLSVVGVEKQLLALGARLVDNETLELNIMSPLTQSTNAGEARHTQPESWSFVDFFSPDQLRPKPNTLTMRLSISLLISNLSRRAVCLMNGPGFPRDELGQAIEASVIMVGGDSAAS